MVYIASTVNVLHVFLAPFISTFSTSFSVYLLVIRTTCPPPCESSPTQISCGPSQTSTSYWYDDPPSDCRGANRIISLLLDALDSFNSKLRSSANCPVVTSIVRTFFLLNSYEHTLPLPQVAVAQVR